MIPSLPFQFKHATTSVGLVFTAESIDEHGRVRITWPEDKFDPAGDTTYSSTAIADCLRRGTWVLLEPKIDLRTALKIKLFEMRIATMEASLAALKQEFELHKQDVKGTH